MRTAIVTGATGFIGSWLVQELLENDYDVTVIVRNKDRLFSGIKKNCNIIEESLKDLSGSNMIDKYNVCFHLAWAGVPSGQKNHLDVQLDNIRTSLHTLEVIHKTGCDLFVTTGTVAEYALCDNVMDLAARQTPNDLYGAAKVSAHYFMEVCARQLGQPFIWCVIPSTFGERRMDNNIITYTIKTLLDGEKPVYGDLHQMWDFLYVKDVVGALRLVGEKGKHGKNYGIGSGEYKTLAEYIRHIRDIIDPTLPLGIGENEEQSKRTFSSCVNNYDLKRDTGFQPRFSFEAGIRRTIDYFKKQKE